MPFPQNLDELVAAGYKFENDARCRYCPLRIEWWITPAGRKIPLEVDDHGSVRAHFGHCAGYIPAKAAELPLRRK